MIPRNRFVALLLGTLCFAAASGFAQTCVTKWQPEPPEPSSNWQGIRFADPDNKQPEPNWLWAHTCYAKEADLVGKPEFAVPEAYKDQYTISLPMYRLTPAGGTKEDRELTNHKSEKEQGVVVKFTATLVPEYRMLIRVSEDPKKGLIEIRRLNSDFKVVWNDPATGTTGERLTMAMYVANLAGAKAEGGRIAGKLHRFSVASSETAASRPPSPPTLTDLKADERQWLLPKEEKDFNDAMSAARAATALEDQRAKAAALNKLYGELMAQIEKRRGDKGEPPLFLSPADRALLSKDDLDKYYADYLKAMTEAGSNDDKLREVTRGYYEKLYPADNLSERELRELSGVEAEKFKEDLAASKTDVPPTTASVVKSWRGYVRRKIAKQPAYWQLFYPSDEALAPYGGPEVVSGIRAKMRASGAAATANASYEARVKTGQKYYCTGLVIKSNVKPTDKASTTMELLRKLAADPSSAEASKLVDGKAERAVAPNPDPLCSGELFTQERVNELLGAGRDMDTVPGGGASFKAGKMDPPTPEPPKAKPGQYNDIINAAKFGMYTALLGFFLGGPVGAVLFGVIGMAGAYFMGKVK